VLRLFSRSSSTSSQRVAVLQRFVDHLLRHDLTPAERYSLIPALQAKPGCNESFPACDLRKRAVIAQGLVDTANGLRDSSPALRGLLVGLRGL
jgi:hypothetical protein